MIIRGTTSHHIFSMPFDVNLIDKISITYAQKEENVIIKENRDLSIDPTLDNVIVDLSQEDTLKFNIDKNIKNNIVNIQIRMKLKDGRAYASRVMKERVYEIYQDGII